MSFWPPCFESKANLSNKSHPGNRAEVHMKGQASPITEILVTGIKIFPYEHIEILQRKQE